MSSNNDRNNFILMEHQRILADEKKIRLEKTLEEIDAIERSRSAAADDDDIDSIPIHIWRPAWSTTQTVDLIKKVYMQNQILSKTLDKISEKWQGNEDYISEDIKTQINSKSYQEAVQYDKDKLFGSVNYPQTKNMGDFIKKDSITSFPFKERIAERKKQRGIK